jgi:hypothetical protein
MAPTQVAHERVEDEVIAINLSTGTYFSLRDSAADVWSLLIAGADVDGAAAALAGAYDADVAPFADDVRVFVASLVAEGLVAELPDEAPATVAGPSTTRPYAPPVVERYDDMEDLLLLDPIHEVDDAGWPVIAVEPS